MDKIICGRKNELDYLENLSKEDLVDWIRGFLEENRSRPLSLSSKGSYNSTILLQKYHSSTKSDFKRGFENAIYKLINSWRESTDSPDYLAELLSIAGMIRIDDTYSRLLVLAKHGNLQGRTGLGVDLHYQILRVLFGFGMDKNREDLEFIINRDIENPPYSPLCFRRSWELEFRNGIENIPNLIKCYHENRLIDAEGTLERFFEKLGKRGFMREFLNILKKLDDPYYFDFYEILRLINIELSPASFGVKDGLIVKWKEKNRSYLLWIEIPDKLGKELESMVASLLFHCWEKNGSFLIEDIDENAEFCSVTPVVMR